MKKIILVVFSVIMPSALYAEESKKTKTFTEGLADRVIDSAVKSLENSEELRKQCVNIIMSTQTMMDPNLFMRGILKQFGIEFLPLESIYRIQRAFALCACTNPKATAASIGVANFAPVAEVCWGTVVSATLEEIGRYWYLAWYYTKFLSHRVLGTLAPTRGSEVPILFGKNNSQ